MASIYFSKKCVLLNWLNFIQTENSLLDVKLNDFSHFQQYKIIETLALTKKLSV